MRRSLYSSLLASSQSTLSGHNLLHTPSRHTTNCALAYECLIERSRAGPCRQGGMLILSKPSAQMLAVLRWVADFERRRKYWRLWECLEAHYLCSSNSGGYPVGYKGSHIHKSHLRNSEDKLRRNDSQHLRSTTDDLTSMVLI